MAHRHGWTASDAGARLVEEGLRRSEFAFIDFRNSPVGRQAFLQGSSLAVWELVWLARDYRNDAEKVARHLQWPVAKVRAAFHYAESFPEEIRAALVEQDEMNFTNLKRMLPSIETAGRVRPKRRT